MSFIQHRPPACAGSVADSSASRNCHVPGGPSRNDDRWVFTADQTKPEVAAIEVSTNTVKLRIPLPALGFGLSATRDSRLLVTHPGENSVSVVSLKPMRVESTIRVPAQPQEVLVRPDDRVAYISCDEASG